MADEEQFLRPFGPVILKSTVNEEIFSLLKNAVEASKISRSSAPDLLAGTFMHGSNKDLMLDMASRSIFVNWVQIQAKKYFEKIENRQLMHMSNQLRLEHLWVNFQKAGDFNPIHTHSGLLSFVIYIEVPEFVNEQKQAGEIGFRYGSQHDLSPSSISILPKNQDFLMFPAWLDHYVWPFTFSKGTRISVAGNLFLN